MSSRDHMLGLMAKNQPALLPLEETKLEVISYKDPVRQFAETLTAIGGKAIMVKDFSEIKMRIREEFDTTKRIVTTIPEFSDLAEMFSASVLPHSFENTELTLLHTDFAVAENGAVWITEDIMGQRILPFICQHLAVIVYADNILPTMQEAYERIASRRYGFGSFIAGPSKTADIEQALVLGAHGPRTMTVFTLNV